MFRFVIGPVRVFGTSLDIDESKLLLVEAENCEAASNMAEQKWPDDQIVIIRVGRVHVATASSSVKMQDKS